MALAIVASSFIPVKAGFGSEVEQNIVSAETTSFTTEHGVQHPVQNVAVSQGYKLFHPGLDFDGVTGQFIYPAIAGEVSAVSYSRYGYGNAIIIEHRNGLTTLYAHLNEIYVKKDQEVTTKFVIGTMGSTGNANGDHLHFEVRDNKRPINPYSVLPR